MEMCLPLGIGFVDVEMFKPVAIDYHVIRCGKINQPRTIEGTVIDKVELFDIGAKDTFPPNIRIEVFLDDFGIRGRALIVYFLAICLKGILNLIVPIFRQSISGNEGDVIKFLFNMDCR